MPTAIATNPAPPGGPTFDSASPSGLGVAVPARRWMFVGVGLLLTFALVGAGSLFCINLMAIQTVRSNTTYPFSGSAVEVDVALGDVRSNGAALVR